jgi:hypothetical protein
LGDLPTSDETDETVQAYFADSGNRTQNVITLYLLALAGIAFLWFLGQLRSVLRRSEGEPGTLSGIAFGSGVVFVAMLFASSAAFGAVAAAMEFGDIVQPGADISRLLPHLGYVFLLIFGMLAASSMMFATSLVAWRTGVLPRWLVWTGFGCAVILLFSVVFVPMIALPIWVVAVSVALLRRA